MDFDSAAQPPVGTPWHEATFGASFVRFWRGYAVFRGRTARAEFWFWRGYAVFRGRTARAEFWFWALWWFLISLLANIAFGAGVLTSFTDPSGPAAPPPQVEQALEAFDLFPVWGYLLSALPPVGQIALGVFAVLSLASLVPWIAITVRRLHDTGRSGWWVLLAAVPLGNAVLAVLLVLPSITESTGGAMAHPSVR